MLNALIFIFIFMLLLKCGGQKYFVKNATWDCTQKQTFTANTHTTRNTYLAKIANMKNMQRGAKTAAVVTFVHFSLKVLSGQIGSS